MRAIVSRAFVASIVAGGLVLIAVAARRQMSLEAPASLDAAIPLAEAGADASAEDASADADAEATFDAALPEDAANAKLAFIDDTPLCTAFGRQEWARIDRLVDAVDSGVKQANVPGDAVVCHATPGGAWASTLDAPGFVFRDPYIEAEGTWTLLHLDPNGKRASAPVTDSRFGFSMSLYGQHHDHRIEVLADYDGDGEPELLVWDANVYSEGDIPENYAIYTFRNGKHRTVDIYPPSALITIESMKDIDDDARPDILTSVGTVRDYTTCLGSHDISVFDWPAHAAANGKFEMTDTAARAYVASRCAKARKRLIDPRARVMDLDAIAEAVVCARVAGRPSDAIRAELQAGCDEYQSEVDFCHGPPPKRVCPDWFNTLPDIALPIDAPSEISDTGAAVLDAGAAVLDARDD